MAQTPYLNLPNGSMTVGTLTATTLTATSLTAAGAQDLNGYELILDADADTSITADTDDQIDIRLSGADDFQFTANTFTALSGSVITSNTISETTAASGVTVDGVLVKDGGIVCADGASIEVDIVAEATAAAGVTIDGLLLKDGKVDLNGVAGALIIDADADTFLGASTDDQIDITVSGAIDFTITANTLTAVSGSTIATNTISETTAAAGVTIDSVLLKDGINHGLISPSNVFLSTEQTGTGSSQNVAHGLGAVPGLVFAIASNLTGGAYVVVYGAHDATNAVVTVTSGEKFRIVAFK